MICYHGTINNLAEYGGGLGTNKNRNDQRNERAKQNVCVPTHSTKKEQQGAKRESSAPGASDQRKSAISETPLPSPALLGDRTPTKGRQSKSEPTMDSNTVRVYLAMHTIK